MTDQNRYASLLHPAEGDASLAQKIYEVVGHVVKIAVEEINPITDVRSTAWYRREVSRVLVCDALQIARQRSGE